MSRSGARPDAREVGTVLSVTPTGQLTLRSPSAEVVSEGTAVRDRRGAVRGKVVRVFGPVARPYLTVRPRRTPTPEEGLELVGATLIREDRER